MEPIVRALYGSYRLYRLDARGLGFFDASIAGYWRSFLAAVIAAPFAVLINAMAPTGIEAEWTTTTVLVKAVSYAAGWAIMPLAATYLTRLYGLSGRYVPYIVALNWNAAVSMAILTPMVALGRSIGEDSIGVIGLPLLIYIVYVEWFTTRLALGTTGWIATTFVAIDIVASIALDALFERLI